MDGIPLVLPLLVHLFLFTVLIVCFEWKKYCQMRSADVPYFSRKERLFYCLKPLNLRHTADNLLLCAAVCSAP